LVCFPSPHFISMASPYEVEVKLNSANNLKNVNWRNGPNRPYVVVWVDPTQKRSTNVDESGDTQPKWDEKLLIPLPPSSSINNSVLFIDVLHSEPNDKPLIIGSTQLPLDTVETEDGSRGNRTLTLRRPSGRPQGTIDIKVIVKNTGYCAPYGVPPPPYGNPYGAPPAPYGNSYGTGVSVTYGNPYNVAPPPLGYPVVAPTPTSYGYSQSTQQGLGSGPSVNVTVGGSTAPEKNNQSYGYGQGGQQGSGYGQSGPTVNVTVGGVAPEKNNAPQSFGYGQSGLQGNGYGQSGSTVNVTVGKEVQQEKKSSKFGLGTGLVMGAVVGGLGALALEKGIDAVEDKIADRVIEKQEIDDYYEEYYNEY
jgi:hypothetical protein